MTKILFVDDEEMVLKGLRRMLFAVQDQWEVSFVTSGAEALEEMANEVYDVIVSDMRMPVMNGNELLAEVMKRHPCTARVILSGHADHDLIIESTCYAHQFISKPCDEDELIAIIERCCRAQELLPDRASAELVSRMSAIPSLPTLYTEILSVLKGDSWGIEDVAAIVARDVGMTAKILQIVNSAFFGFPRHVASAAEAVGVLGVNTLKALVLSVKLFSQFEDDAVGGLDLERVTKHNMRTGLLAQLIAKEEGAPRVVVDQAFLAGNLHDIGRLVLAANMPEQYREVLELVNLGECSLIAAEHRLLGTSHATLGAYLLCLWGLPQPIVEGILYHHEPSASSQTEFDVLAAIHFANALEPILNTATCAAYVEARAVDIDDAFVERLQLSERIPVWQELHQLATTESDQ